MERAPEFSKRHAQWMERRIGRGFRAKSLQPPVRFVRECRAGGHSAKANVGIESGYRCRTPGVGEDGMPGRNEQ